MWIMAPCPLHITHPVEHEQQDQQDQQQDPLEPQLWSCRADMRKVTDAWTLSAEVLMDFRPDSLRIS